MRDIILAFSVGIAFATVVPIGVEDLQSGGPWILTLIVFPVFSLLCLAFVLRDHRRRSSSEDRRLDSSAEQVVSEQR
ncbi:MULTISPECIES: hypothetical protein [unclassified Brevibacterium]|uniref:hypothetical protein n=1 Tax=unclassified Brevibacterium TaxID=2614124 RepID=UPI0010932115|nr:hypothetical protein [Brevibacterium sp. S22]